MRLLCDCKLFLKSIGNGEDRAKFLKRFGSPERFPNVLYVNIVEHKTKRQLGTVRRDLTVIGKLFFTDGESIYIYMLRSDDFLEFFTEKGEDNEYHFTTLGTFDKDKTSRFIEAYRPYWQEKVNEAYGCYMPIDWSKREVSDDLA